jgi:hypothetical protein
MNLEYTFKISGTGVFKNSIFYIDWLKPLVECHVLVVTVTVGGYSAIIHNPEERPPPSSL